jgi:hypothetical protein
MKKGPWTNFTGLSRHLLGKPKKNLIQDNQRLNRNSLTEFKENLFSDSVQSESMN